MKSELIRQCRQLSRSGYKIHQIALAVGVTDSQVEYALQETNEAREHKGSPDELVDGERMEDRIERLKREIKLGQLVVPRTGRNQEIKYYVALPEGLK